MKTSRLAFVALVLVLGCSKTESRTEPERAAPAPSAAPVPPGPAAEPRSVPMQVVENVRAKAEVQRIEDKLEAESKAMADLEAAMDAKLAELEAAKDDAERTRLKKELAEAARKIQEARARIGKDRAPAPAVKVDCDPNDPLCGQK